MKKHLVFMWILGFVLGGVLVSYAENLIVSAEQVKAVLEGAGKSMIIDARSRDEYREAHIPGAVNIAPDRMRSEYARLPKDKSTTLIFYCRGVG